MGPCGVVVGDPGGDGAAGMVEAEKQRLVQELVAHLRIEGLADPVLHWLAWSDEVPGHARLLAPGQHRVRGELGPMVADDQAGPPPPGDQRHQFPRHAAPRDRSVDHGRQAFLRDIVDHVEDPEPPALDELVVDEVDRPARVRHGHWTCPGFVESV